MLGMQTTITQHIKKMGKYDPYGDCGKISDDVGPPYDKVNLPQDFSISSDLQTST